MALLKEFHVHSKKVELPIFLPDATHGFVRGVSTLDLVSCGIKGLVVNTYHLFRDGLVDEIKQKGGIGKYMGLPAEMMTITDSGGFQVFSIIHESPEYGKLDDNGATFTFGEKKIELTPEKCIQIQIDIGADIIMCLDDCTSPEMSGEEQEISVRRTIDWAARCKKEFLRLTKNFGDDKRPLLFGIIQGGKNLELRKKCADELIKIDFDGYAFGGWPAENGKFLHELLKYTAELMPDEKPKYAMGIGRPEDIVYCVVVGYTMFDCVIPTREARNNRLYAFRSRLFGFSKHPRKPHTSGNFYKFVRVRNAKYKDEKKPISSHCDCECCRENNCAKIYELFRKKDKESIRLATMHNLRFYTMLIEMLKEKEKR
jgi:queuine tRNA-ribosyltransferase